MSETLLFSKNYLVFANTHELLSFHNVNNKNIDPVADPGVGGTTP